MKDIWIGLLGLTFLFIGFFGIIASIELYDFKFFLEFFILIFGCLLMGLGIKLITASLVEVEE